MSGAIVDLAGSYNSNSLSQLAAVEISIPYIRQAIDIFDITRSSSPLIIADYGSAHGLNSMYAMKTTLKYLKETKHMEDEKEILVIHNDLPTNNWVSLFELLNNANSYHGLANGRSFYEQCLPSNCLSIGYSSNSIHWLSRKPCHLLNHCSSVFAQGDELTAFQRQSRLDLAQFLEHRSRELHVGGVLVLSIFCTNEQGSAGIERSYDLLYKCAQSLSYLTHQELVDYNIPLHIRSPAECIDLELFDQCSLELIKSALDKVKPPLFDQYLDGQLTLDEFARIRTQGLRCYTESALRQSLESNGRSKEDSENILTKYWTLYEEQVKERPHDHELSTFRIHLILKKIPKKKQ